MSIAQSRPCSSHGIDNAVRHCRARDVAGKGIAGQRDAVRAQTLVLEPTAPAADKPQGAVGIDDHVVGYPHIRGGMGEDAAARRAHDQVAVDVDPGGEVVQVDPEREMAGFPSVTDQVQAQDIVDPV
jgi:hypothetical protein